MGFQSRLFFYKWVSFSSFAAVNPAISTKKYTLEDHEKYLEQ